MPTSDTLTHASVLCATMDDLSPRRRDTALFPDWNELHAPLFVYLIRTEMTYVFGFLLPASIKADMRVQSARSFSVPC